MSDLVERLRWHGNPNQRALLSEAADRIEELEAEIERLREKFNKQAIILKAAFPEKSGHYFICGEAGEKDTMGLPQSILVCPTYGADIRCTTRYIKAAEVETPERPSKPDPIPPQSSSAPTGEMILHDCDLGVSVCSQADFQEHKRDMEQALQRQSGWNQATTNRLNAMLCQLEALEERMLEASPSREGLDPNASTPAFHGSEDRTPEPQLGDKVQDGRVYRRADPDQRFVGWFPERRSGKERRESKIEQTTSERHYVIEQKIYPTRRGNANRRKVDRGQGQ